MYAPDPGSGLAGEVEGSRIPVYELDEEDLETLRHEFLNDYISGGIMKPSVSHADQPVDKGQRGENI